MVAQKKVDFENGLNLTGFGRYNVLMFMLCSGIIMGMAFEIMSVSYVVPASSCELGTSSVQQGLMAGVPLFGIILTSHFWGYMADTKGRRKILCVCMTIGSIAGALSALSPNWLVLSFLKLVSSATVGNAYAITMAYLSECTPEARRSLLVILTSSIFVAANGFMAIITIPILPLDFSYYIPFLDIYFNSWRLLILVFASPAAICAFCVNLAYESPKYLLSIGREEEALNTLKRIFAINKRKSPDMYEVKSVVLNEDSGTMKKGMISSMVAQTKPMFRPPLLKRTLLLGAMFSATYMCYHPFMVWLPFIVNAYMAPVDDMSLTVCDMVRHFTNSTTDTKAPHDCSLDQFAMVVIFGINVIMSVSNICMSSLMTWFGRKKVLITLQFLSGVAALSLVFSRVPALSAVFLLVFLTGMLNFGILTTFVVDVFPTYVRAMAVCFTLMVGRGSAVGGINVLKILLEVNCDSAFYIFGGIGIFGGLLGFLLPSDQELQEQKQMKRAS